MTWTIRLSSKAVKSLKKIDKKQEKRIYKELREISLLDNPRSRGKALTGHLTGFWRYRVGDYRIICDIEDNVLVVLVIDIAHRREVYRKK